MIQAEIYRATVPRGVDGEPPRMPQWGNMSKGVPNSSRIWQVLGHR